MAASKYNNPLLEDILSNLNNGKLGNDELESLREYASAIELLSEQDLAIEFNNKDANHAKMVMVQLFSKAKSEIKIFANCFSGEISNDPSYLKALESAIDKKVKVDVILENHPNPKSKCIELLKSKINSFNISVIKMNDKTKNQILRNNNLSELANFTVIDSKMFRLENDTKHFKAICNFDDVKNSIILTQNFNKLGFEGIDIL